ncbi:dTDP-4-dehydrorhamnose reductase [Musicola paradisiaca]|uniref:dTDP-4-dehydrorhamnose reductase n=1 Tax=Musicola paradisiaca (strain Ech703) TaxID=579405 RepID=C6CDH8_MUSP7|nr:dTDP-4-dehydrorhamnose reductase [Musicola paradisiaca]ACS87049.1 dTDP-4-dehydrorhamnose reductase [Musicola paradisiaca Ech703]
MRILITGSQGQLGQHLVSYLNGKAELLATGRDSLDITNKNQVIDKVKTFNPDYIINAAAYTAVDNAEDDSERCYAINRDGPAHLAEAANIANAVLLHISTDYVFDGRAEQPYTEDMPTHPLNVYGASKLAGEQAVAEIARKFLIIRTSWVFGEYGNNFVKAILRLAATRNMLNIVNDQFGGPTYSGDIANTLIELIHYIEQGNTPAWGIYHYSGTPAVSWFEFAGAILEQAKAHNLLEAYPKLSGIPSVDYPTKAKRPANSVLNCDRITKQFGLAPSQWLSAINDIEKYK